MLQNFADLEDATRSKAGIWLLIGRDLPVSLFSEYSGSRLGRYVIAAFVTWILLFAIGYRLYGSTPGHPALHVFGGFLPGILATYVATRLCGMPRGRNSFIFRSRFDIYVIGVLFAWIFLFVIGYCFFGSTRGNPALQVFGGLLIGMVAMYIATRVYGMP